MPNGCQLNECGHTSDGLRVQAITDVMGAQVVVTNKAKPEDDSLLSEPLANHGAAVELGKRVARYGLAIYPDWRGPIDSLEELVSVISK